MECLHDQWQRSCQYKRRVSHLLGNLPESLTFGGDPLPLQEFFPCSTCPYSILCDLYAESWGSMLRYVIVTVVFLSLIFASVCWLRVYYLTLSFYWWYSLVSLTCFPPPCQTTRALLNLHMWAVATLAKRECVTYELVIHNTVSVPQNNPFYGSTPPVSHLTRNTVISLTVSKKEESSNVA